VLGMRTIGAQWVGQWSIQILGRGGKPLVKRETVSTCNRGDKVVREGGEFEKTQRRMEKKGIMKDRGLATLPSRRMRSASLKDATANRSLRYFGLSGGKIGQGRQQIRDSASSSSQFDKQSRERKFK